METSRQQYYDETASKVSKERDDLPGSSGNKEGLRARMEGVERIEAADEGLERLRGIESECDVECIQSPGSFVGGCQALTLSLDGFPFLTFAYLWLSSCTPLGSPSESWTRSPLGRLCGECHTAGHNHLRPQRVLCLYPFKCISMIPASLCGKPRVIL